MLFLLDKSKKEREIRRKSELDPMDAVRNEAGKVKGRSASMPKVPLYYPSGTKEKSPSPLAYGSRSVVDRRLNSTGACEHQHSLRRASEYALGISGNHEQRKFSLYVPECSNGQASSGKSSKSSSPSYSQEDLLKYDHGRGKSARRDGTARRSVSPCARGKTHKKI